MTARIIVRMVLLFAGLFAPLSKVVPCGLSWSLPKDHFDGVNEYGFVSIWDQIGTLDLGEGLKIPLIIGFQSDREWSSQYAGQGFIFALFDSRIEQVDEDTFRMLKPDGWTATFRRDRKNKTILNGSAGWKAEVGDNTITAYASCGWKLVYKQGKIAAITTPKNRVLDFVYSGARVAEIRDKGATLIRSKTDSDTGQVNGLVFGNEEIDFEQGQRPQIQNINGINLVSGMSLALASVNSTKGVKKAYKFSVDDKLNPTITINSDRTITWNVITKKILKDGQWSYQIKQGDSPQSYAAIGRTNGSNQSEFWHLDAAKGRETIVLNGTKTIKTWFVSGVLRGDIRKVEKVVGNKVNLDYQAVYDDKGKLIRSYDSNNIATNYVYDDKGRRVSKNREGKQVWSRTYFGEDNSHETTTENGEKVVRIQNTNAKYADFLPKLSKEQKAKLPDVPFYEKVTSNGKSRYFFYSASGKTLAEVNSSNVLITFLYDEGGKLVWTLRNGLPWIENKYDIEGRLLSRREFDEISENIYTQEFAYNTNGAIKKISNTNLLKRTTEIIEDGMTTVLVNNEIKE